MKIAQSRTWRAIDRLLTAILITMVAASSIMPAAYALDTVKCTARPNADTGSDVLGGIETRVTWEGQAAPDEAVKAIATGEEYGIAVSKDNPALTAAINDALAKMVADGTLDKLLEQYL